MKSCVLCIVVLTICEFGTRKSGAAQSIFKDNMDRNFELIVAEWLRFSKQAKHGFRRYSLTIQSKITGKTTRIIKMATPTELTEISSYKTFGGYQKTFSHNSQTVGCLMKFSVYLPPQAEEKKVPVIYWLSGLTCNEENFIQKSGAQRYAAEHGVVLVCPDTSPRGLNIPGDSDAWDFGVGAGFYVDATQKPWSNNYKMFSYITKELLSVVNSNFPILAGKQSIMGHSMGGHGALICALKNPGLYRSVSAFAPISNPSQCPWGEKALSGYLGPKETGNWEEWDATELVKKYNGPPLIVLIDQGSSDKFYEQKQLLPENLLAACKESNLPAIMKLREGYDHSYYYIASFIGDHIEYHMTQLNF